MSNTMVFIDKDELEGIIEYSGMKIKDFAKTIGVTPATIYNAKGGMYVSNETAKRISEYSGVPMNELCEETSQVVDYTDETALDLSEVIIMGLVRKITKRLEVNHTQNYIDEIVKVVNEIIIEASYFGVEAHKANQHDIIRRAVKKRRKS